MKITLLLILIIVVSFFSVGVVPDSEAVFNNLGFSGNNLVEGKIWTLITSIFLHGGPVHLILNCIALFFFGRAVEDEIPAPTYLSIFFIGGIVGNLFVLFTYPANEIVIGASGAIFAVMGTGILLAPMDFIPYPIPLPLPLALIGIFVAISEVIAFLSGMNGHIARIAHIGGLLTGLVFGLREGESKKGLIVLAVMLLILMLLPNFWPIVSKLSYLNFIEKVFTI